MANRYSATSEKSAAKQARELKSSRDSGQHTASEEQGIHEMIATAAYYRAERSGFNCNDVENWLEAEKEIKGRFFH